MKLSERLEASLISMSHLCSVDQQVWNVHSNDVLEAKVLLEECERILEVILPDQFYHRQAVVDILAKLRAQEKADE